MSGGGSSKWAHKSFSYAHRQQSPGHLRRRVVTKGRQWGLSSVKTLYCMASLTLIYARLNISRSNGGLLVSDKFSWPISIEKEEMQGHSSQCVQYGYIDGSMSEIEMFFSWIRGWIFEKHGLQQWQVLWSPALGRTLIPIAGIDSRAIPWVHSTVHAGHSGGVDIREFAGLRCWSGVLLHISQVIQVAGSGEFLGTGCWLGFKVRKGV